MARNRLNIYGVSVRVFVYHGQTYIEAKPLPGSGLVGYRKFMPASKKKIKVKFVKAK